VKKVNKEANIWLEVYFGIKKLKKFVILIKMDPP
jgi:hypothetical protein